MDLVKRDPEKGYMDSFLWVPKKHVNVNSIRSALTFCFYDHLGSEKALQLFHEAPDHILVPREFWKPEELPFPLVNCCPETYKKTRVQSKIVLDAQYPEEIIQKDAVEKLQDARGGILQLRCGGGKTVVILEVIARLKVPAIIIVDNTQLLHQWMGEIEKHLIVPGGVGLVQGSSMDWEKDVVLATYQTLAARADKLPKQMRTHFGVAVWDEAHHVSAPVFSRTASLFYGRRFGLTATPERVDGTQVVYDFHIGPVLYKNLVQKLKPKIFFLWTGLTPDFQDPQVLEKIVDKKKNLHLSKLSSYFGEWTTRLKYTHNLVKSAALKGRKILVLSNSVAELINLYSLWCGLPLTYSNLSELPTEDSEKLLAQHGVCALTKDEKTLKRLVTRAKKVSVHSPYEAQRNEAKLLLDMYQKQLDYLDSLRELEAEQRKKQNQYIKEITKSPKAGLLIYKIPPDTRRQMLKTMQVTFSIMKYGREGLDEKSLDTIIVCEPISQRNGLQQIMGRALRFMHGKKEPVLIFLEDNIPPMIGMCQQLRKHLRQWPKDEGGPYGYSLVNNPYRPGIRVEPQFQWIQNITPLPSSHSSTKNGALVRSARLGYAVRLQTETSSQERGQ